DSVHMQGTNGTSEFILENSTKTVPGYLYNKGNGRTEFRVPGFVDSLARVGDSIFGYSKGIRITGIFLPMSSPDSLCLERYHADSIRLRNNTMLGTGHRRN